tara:strand:- start:887 stop:2389 length:1503 start_codon:yes stop_codon:yes gene_type:complete
MARQALIKLRRGTGAPGNAVLAEGELAIDIAAKKLYSANSSGSAFTLSGDQYNFAPSGNSTQASLTLTVDNDALSNDSVTIVGSGGITVSGNTTQITVDAAAALDYDLGVTGNTTQGQIVLSGDGDADTVNINGGTNITVDATDGTNIGVALDSAIDLGASGSLSIGNSTVNAVISSGGNIVTDGNLDFGGTLTFGGTLVSADAGELNKLDGATSSTAELNYVTGVTSGIQGQIDTLTSGKVANGQAVTFTTVTASGLADLNGALEVAGLSTLSGNATASANLNVGGGFGVTGDAALGANVSVVGTTDLNGDLDVAGLSTLTGNVTISDAVSVADSVTVGNSTVNAVITSAGNIDSDGSLTIAGASDLNGTLDVAGLSTLTGNVTMSDDASVGGDLVVSGNFTVSGSQTIVSSTTVALTDSLLKLASDQTGTDTDAVDIGFYGVYDVGGTDKYAGMFRDTSDANKKFVLVDGITAEPGTTVTYADTDLAYLEAIIDGGTY